MADEQVAAVRQYLRIAVEQPPLRILVEIDHHIAAEDEIERAAERPLVEQVEPLEGDHALQFCRHFDLARVRSPALAEPAPAALLRQSLEAVRVVDAGARPVQYVGIEIGGQDLDVPSVHVGQGFADHHGDGIGFLTGGTAGRPHA